QLFLTSGSEQLRRRHAPRARAKRRVAGTSGSEPQTDNGYGYRSSCVHRKRASFLPASFVTVASQTCVVRPPWTSSDVQDSVPSSAVPRKFVLSSIVVKPYAPSGRDAIQPYPRAESASPTTAAACR